MIPRNGIYYIQNACVGPYRICEVGLDLELQMAYRLQTNMMLGFDGSLRNSSHCMSARP